MKYFGYALTAFINLITLAVIVVIFSASLSRFETITFSLLLLIYLQVLALGASYGQTETRTLLAIDFEFKRIRRLLNDQESADEKATVEEASERLARTQRQYVITAISQLIMFLIVLWHLFKELAR